MRTVELGNDKIPAVAVGTWSWGTGINGGNKVFGNSYGYEDLFPVFKCGVEEGLTLWDTAAVYGMGASETILGRCIEKYKDIVVSTKFTPLGIQGRKAMVKSFNKSSERLKHCIDIYWIHNASNVQKWTEQAAELYKTGMVKHIGVSNHNLKQVQEASRILESHGIHLGAVQNHYSLLYRQSEEEGILNWCKENNTRFFAYMILEQGALTGKYSESNPFKAGTRRAKAFPAETLGKLKPLINCMQAIADKHCADVSRIIIAWAMGKGIIPLVGATKVSQIESISKADKITLEQGEIELIEQAVLKTGVSVKASWER
jgi:Predicted oxidoreductases (related to aryl-alcohol dehydrogenases)